MLRCRVCRLLNAQSSHDYSAGHGGVVDGCPGLGVQDLRSQPCCRHALELVTTTVREDARSVFAHLDWRSRDSASGHQHGFGVVA